MKQIATPPSNMAEDDVFIVGFCRTPFGVAFSGSLTHLSAPELASHAIKGCLTQVLGESEGRFRSEMIDEVLLGHVVSAGCGQAPATQAIRLAGLSGSVTASTVNKVCSSGMKAITLGATLIKSGRASCVLAGGMESMSSVPFGLPKQLRCANRGLRYGNAELTDLLAWDGLTDAESAQAMGEAAERIAERYNISREEMDAFGRRSYERAIAARHLFETEEIISVPGPDGQTLIVSDDGPKQFRPERISSLKTPFRPANGRVTAATSSQITDGAAVCLLMSGAKMREAGISPVARVVDWSDGGVEDPMDFPVAPVKAINSLLAANPGFSVELFEINEAFAVVPLAVARECSGVMAEQNVNVLGGAIALGHPLGASGARIVGTLITALRGEGKRRGCAAICNGGGGSTALLLELAE